MDSSFAWSSQKQLGFYSILYLAYQQIAKQLEILRSDICKRFEDAKFQYQVGNSLSGQAILSPYSPGSDSISKSARDGREGYFG